LDFVILIRLLTSRHGILSWVLFVCINKSGNADYLINASLGSYCLVNGGMNDDQWVLGILCCG